MSYESPIIKTVSNPSGLDVAIASIQAGLNDLDWLEYSFGRAWEFSENRGGRVVKVPKVYEGEGEYLNMLPNDFLKAYSFIMCGGPEIWPDFTKGLANPKERRLSLIFWMNLTSIGTADDINTEYFKADVERILKASPYLKSIDSYIDEKAEDVFKGYINSGAGTMSNTDDDASQYLMYPYTGMRFSITVGYMDPVC